MTCQRQGRFGQPVYAHHRKPRFSQFFPILLAALTAVFSSCGLEDYIYLEPVQIVEVTSDSRVRIVFPDNSTNSNFRNYTIFYRIYISDFPSTGTIPESQHININTALDSDYNYLKPYTNNDNVSPNAVLSAFNSRHYYFLYVTTDKSNEIGLERLLGTVGYGGFPSPSQNDTITLDFTDSTKGPFMILSYEPGAPPHTEFYLFRTRNITALPDRLFFNNNTLNDGSFIMNTTNSDVQSKAGISGTRYTYVSLYILATGIDNNFSVVFSRPKHAGIFRLPNP